MKTTLIFLFTAFSSLPSTAEPVAETPISWGFKSALATAANEGPVTEWITPKSALSSPGQNLRSGQGVTIRGQSEPAYDSGPQSQSSSPAQTFVQGADPNQPIITGPQFPPGTLYQPGGAAPYDPFIGGADPFLMQGAPFGTQYYDPYSRDFQYGGLGAQPYRLGALTNLEAGYIGKASTSGVKGSMSTTEVNAAWRFSSYLPSSAIFSWKPEFNYRGYDGPDGVGVPGHAYRFASDFELAGQGPGPWGYQLGFTPQLVTDFDRQLNSDAYSWDGRAMLFFRPDPTLMLVGGFAYWDRVNDRFIPYAGVVWTPDDRWEFRLLAPKSRISVLLGDYGYGGVWLYGTAEYNVEAYQVGIADANRGDRMQVSDYRFLLGLRSGDSATVSSFLEGGWVTNRHVEFQGKTADFGIGDSWIVRTGIRF